MFKKCLWAAFAAIVMSSAVQASAPAPTQAQQRYEVQFMTEMIDHHAMAVMTAELCMERAVHPELRAMCEQIRHVQLEEIATLQTWLEEWYGVEHEPSMTPGMENHMRKMAALSGADFEIEFMKMMIRHHWTAVVRAQQCQRRAYHTSLIEMCEDIESAQKAEIRIMGEWLCQWYGICEYRTGQGA